MTLSKQEKEALSSLLQPTKKTPSHSSGQEIKTLYLHLKLRKETLTRLLLLEGIIHQDVVEIDLRCDKILPQF